MGHRLVGMGTALALAGVLAPGLALVVAVRAWRGAADLFNPTRHVPVRWPADEGAPPDLTSIGFIDQEGNDIRGWHVPSKNGATIVLVHGSVADRAQLAPEAGLLARRGFGVLLYDEPGSGESSGRVTVGRSERAALRAALDWLHGRDADQTIGLYGFSQGAYIAAQVAVEATDLRGLVLAGPVADFREQTRYTFRRYGPLSMIPALMARQRAGWMPSEPRALDVIGSFRRPLLVISGEWDVDVPPDHARRLFDAAAPPKEWWVVPGAGHGGYAGVAREAYASRLIAFYDLALLR